MQLDRAGAANAELDNRGVRRHCGIGRNLRRFLEDAASSKGLSPRACQRILRVARTLADLDGQPDIGADQLAEAVALRGMDSD